MKPMLLDECLTCDFSLTYPITKQFPRSVDVLGEGAKDKEILDYILKQNYGLVTADIRFSLLALWNNVPVIFHKYDGFRCYIRPSSKQLERVICRNERITNYLLQHDEVVIP